MSRMRLPLLAGACVLLSVPMLAQNQNPTVPDPTPVTTTNGDGSVKTTTSTTTDSAGNKTQSVGTSVTFNRGKKKKDKDEKIQQTKDTRKAQAKARSAEALVGVDSRLPDKQLYDKAVIAMNKGHYDVARLDLQTMLNTYPDSQYQMRAKLAIADSWYKEGGTAALTQAESEYADFRVFFPNVPEAAEAQMRIGDIYFRQMDRPDRDYGKAVHAEEEYRRMLTDYPDSVLIPQAKQRLREVQEVMASREADIASFYATRGNVAAEIARYETVVETYPLYSHMDDVLIGLGDAYEVEAKYIRSLPGLPEGPRAKLEKEYDSLAADAYRKVVLEHSAAPHVDDARERLQAMNLPVPEPTEAQKAASLALEDSRASYKLTDRVGLLFLHKPDTVLTSTIGNPSLVDPKAVSAPSVVHQFENDGKAAFAPPGALAADAALSTGSPASAAASGPDPAPVAATPASTAPLSLSDIPAADNGGAAVPVATPAVTTTVTTGTVTNSVGVEILPSDKTPAVPTGMETVGPNHTGAMAPIEAPAPAPDQINDVAGKATPAAQVVEPGKKAPKPEFDKSDESSSKHKPKKGIKKVIPPNPF